MAFLRSEPIEIYFPVRNICLNNEKLEIVLICDAGRSRNGVLDPKNDDEYKRIGILCKALVVIVLYCAIIFFSVQ